MSNGAGAASSSTIGSAARIRGRVLGEGDLIIEGHLEGDITLRGDLTIVAGGSAASNVDASSVTVAGTLEGDVSSASVRITAGARVHGNVTSGQIAIEDGAEFAGRLECEFELPAELNDGGANANRGTAARRR